MLYNGNIKGNKWNAETSVLEFHKIYLLSTDLRTQTTVPDLYVQDSVFSVICLGPPKDSKAYAINQPIRVFITLKSCGMLYVVHTFCLL